MWYTYHKDGAVISPEEAYRELKSGAVIYADALKSHANCNEIKNRAVSLVEAPLFLCYNIIILIFN